MVITNSILLHFPTFSEDKPELNISIITYVNATDSDDREQNARSFVDTKCPAVAQV